MTHDERLEARLSTAIIALAGGLLSAILGVGSAYFVWARLAHPEQASALVAAGIPVILTLLILAAMPWRKAPMRLMGLAYVAFLAFALAFGSGLFTRLGA